ncbi:MAG: hypothetical protein JNK63_09810 [Chthonomonas sp.]|nr:hypothetical protein [Chthonomonas sp.]
MNQKLIIGKWSAWTSYRQRSLILGNVEGEEVQTSEGYKVHIFHRYPDWQSVGSDFFKFSHQAHRWFREKAKELTKNEVVA